MNIDSHYLVGCLHMLSVDWRTPAEHGELVKHGHVLLPLPKRQGGVHSFVQMHAPDQTADRPQLFHCSYDLGRIAPLYKMPPAATRIFIAIRGPQAHWDSGGPPEERGQESLRGMSPVLQDVGKSLASE